MIINIIEICFPKLLFPVKFKHLADNVFSSFKLFVSIDCGNNAIVVFAGRSFSTIVFDRFHYVFTVVLALLSIFSS
jgi:hypothetical protein